MKPGSAKDKGRRLQKLVCEKISKLLDIPFDNTDDFCLIHSREMGQSGTDIILRGEAREKFPFDIECKNTEKLQLNKAIKQAENNSEKDNWLIVHKKNRMEPIVILKFDVFLKIYSDYLEYQKLKLEVGNV